MLLSDLSVDSISGEWSLKGASQLYCVSQWGFHRPWESEGAVACVQDFGRHPLFTQRIFFSETSIGMPITAVTAADAVRHTSKFDPWGVVGVEAGPVVTDLKSCREKIVSWRKALKDTRKQWFGAETVAASVVGEGAPRTTVRVSDVVDGGMMAGDVHHVEEQNKFGLLCCSESVSSQLKSKKRRVPVSPVAAKKNIFLLEVRLLAVFHLKLLLKTIFRSQV